MEMYTKIIVGSQKLVILPMMTIGELQGIYFNKYISINLSNIIDSSSIELTER